MKYMLLIYADEQPGPRPSASSVRRVTRLAHMLKAKWPVCEYFAARSRYRLQPAFRCANGKARVTERPIRRDARTTWRLLYGRSQNLDDAINMPDGFPAARKARSKIRPVREIPGPYPGNPVLIQLRRKKIWKRTYARTSTTPPAGL